MFEVVMRKVPLHAYVKCDACHKSEVVCVMHLVTFLIGINKFEVEVKDVRGTNISWIKWHFPPNVRWLTFSDVRLGSIVVL
jgi:hypothetical protein